MVCWAAGHPGWAAASRTARNPADRRNPRRSPPMVRAVSWSTGSLFLRGISWPGWAIGTLSLIRALGPVHRPPANADGGGTSRKADVALSGGWVRSMTPGRRILRGPEGRARMRQRHQSQTTAILESSRSLRAGHADVARIRARTRRRRLIRFFICFGVLDAYLWYRYATHNPLRPPHLPADAMLWLPAVIFFVLLGLVVVVPVLASGRSPHVLIRPEHIEVGLEEVQGLDGQVEEVVHTLDVFMAYATF